MVFPSSGQISFNRAARELYLNNYWSSTDISSLGPQGLQEMSTGNYFNQSINSHNAVNNRPNQIAPHGFAEFYSYNHDQTAPQMMYKN